MDKMFFELTKTFEDTVEDTVEDIVETVEEEEEFGVAFVDEIDETIGKKKETINNTLQNEPNIANLQLEEEKIVEEGINKTEPEIEQAIEPYLKKKRGKKK
jgi:hypothetical protein